MPSLAQQVSRPCGSQPGERSPRSGAFRFTGRVALCSAVQMTGWLARLFASIDRRELAPAEWLRTGWPRGALILLIALPALLGGPIRYLTQLAPGWALLAAIPIALMAVGPFARAFAHGTL